MSCKHNDIDHGAGSYIEDSCPVVVQSCSPYAEQIEQPTNHTPVGVDGGHPDAGFRVSQTHIMCDLEQGLNLSEPVSFTIDQDSHALLGRQF